MSSSKFNSLAALLQYVHEDEYTWPVEESGVNGDLAVFWLFNIDDRATKIGIVSVCG